MPEGQGPQADPTVQPPTLIARVGLLEQRLQMALELIQQALAATQERENETRTELDRLSIEVVGRSLLFEKVSGDTPELIDVSCLTGPPRFGPTTSGLAE